MKDLEHIVRELKGKGVTLRATEQPVDTGTAASKALLDILGVFAEFETNLRCERPSSFRIDNQSWPPGHTEGPA